MDPVLRTEYGKLSRITNKIILIVKSNYRRGLSLTSIAETLNMSSKYIGRVFLQDTGMKFSAYLTAYRMIQARRLIENSQEKISVVASMVGYSQLNNFYVHFKNYFRISPGALRDYGGSHLDELTGGLEIEDAGALSEEDGRIKMKEGTENMMKKRSYWAGIAALALSLLLTGCGMELLEPV